MRFNWTDRLRAAVVFTALWLLFSDAGLIQWFRQWDIILQTVITGCLVVFLVDWDRFLPDGVGSHLGFQIGMAVALAIVGWGADEFGWIERFLQWEITLQSVIVGVSVAATIELDLFIPKPKDRETE